MNLGHVAVLGFGAIARDLVGILSDRADRWSILVRPEKEAGAASEFARPNVRFTSDLSSILGDAPDVVVECAGHSAVAQYGARVLGAGVDLIVASVGSLSDARLFARLAEAAEKSGAQCVVPAGAIGGIDALGAARLSGLHSVQYTGRKPPMAWAGTPAEKVADLAALAEPCVIFEGTARGAAQAFPKNANVAATLALAGLGMDETQVRLIADPTATENVHEIEVNAEALAFSVRLVGKPSPLNPKTSRSTVFSIARAVLNRSAAIRI